MTTRDAHEKLERVYSALLDLEPDAVLQKADWLANWEARETLAGLLIRVRPRHGHGHAQDSPTV